MFQCVVTQYWCLGEIVMACTTHPPPPAPIARSLQALKVCKLIANRRRTKELKLDDMGSLRLRMEEYQKLKKSGKHSEDFSNTDSDDEDLE